MKKENKPLMLIIPDVHGRTFWRDAVRSYPELPIIFLGDYIDPYTMYDGIMPDDALEEFVEILEFKKQNMDRVTLLLGNHDVHYICTSLRCSRKDYVNQSRIEKLYLENMELFELAHSVRTETMSYLLTHAGVLNGWLENHLPEADSSDAEGLTAILNNTLCDLPTFRRFAAMSLWEIPTSRFGDAWYGSPIWADEAEHSMEENPLSGIYQIFGHTATGGEPIIEKHYADLDCGSKAFVLNEDDGIVDICNDVCYTIARL